MNRLATLFSGIVKIYKALIILKYAFWKYRFQFLVMTGLGFVGGMLGGLGVGMLIPLFALVTDPSGVGSSTFHYFVSKTLGADWTFLMNQKVGYLDRIITQDVSLSGGILMAISDFLVRIASLGSYAFIAFKISVPITAISMIGGVLIFAF